MATQQRVEGTAVARVNPRKEFETSVQLFKPRIADVVGEKAAQRITALAAAAAVRNPDIWKCTPQSVLISLMKVAQTGLELGEEIHLVPMSNKGVMEAQAWTDWKGLAKLMLQGGVVRRVNARAVYEGDVFDYSYGLVPKLDHVPCPDADKRGELVYVYAVARLRGGEDDFEVMSRAEVEKVRQGARSKNSPAWTGHYEQMAQKTVLRRLAKRLPKSARLALDMDEDGEGDGTPLTPFTRPGVDISHAGYGGEETPRLAPSQLQRAADQPDEMEQYQDDSALAED